MPFLPVVPLRDDAPQRRIAYDPSKPLLRSFSSAKAGFAAGDTSPRDVLEACIATLIADEPAIAAFVTYDLDAARAAADAATARWRAGQPLSPIDGMPVVVKDMIETAGTPTGMNNPIYADWPSLRDAASVLAMRQAGAVVLGKTVTTEFACGNSGPTRNPYDTARTPGGSSSGTAAAVGAGMASMGLGTQTHASTIRPAGYCGAYGLKPSFGALHTGGLAQLAPTLDHLGIIGASLEDVWEGAMAIARRAGGTPPYPRLAGPEETPAPAAPRVLVRLRTLGWVETAASSQAAFEAGVARLGAAGVRILDAENDAEVAALEALLADIGEWATDLLAWELRWPLGAYRAHGDGAVGERIHSLLVRAAEMDEVRYERALAAREALRAAVAAFAARADGFVTLCSSGPAISDHGFTGSRNFALPWTLVGGPSFALPLLADQGLPLGMQIASFVGRDAPLCSVAGWVRDAVLVCKESLP